MTDEHNVPMVTGEKFYRMIDHAVEAQLRGGAGSSTLPCFFGGPGTGKTQRVAIGYKEWKERNGSRNLGMDEVSVHVHKVILSGGDSVDVGGAFAPDFDKGELHHLLIKDILGNIKGVNADLIIVFFDELGNANQAMLAAIQSLFEDGEIRGVMKESNCVYMAATNRPEDGCNAIKLPRSLVEGRLVSYHMSVDPKEWIDWAYENDIHPKVIGPIRWRPTLLYEYNPKAKGVNPTPRGWQKLSNLLYEMDDAGDGGDVDILDHHGPGCIGNGTWAITRGFWENSESLATWEEILEDPEGAPLPGSGDSPGEPPSGQFAMAVNISDTLSKMRKEGASVSRQSVRSLITYIRRLEEEIAVFAIRICHDANEDFANSDAYSDFLVDFKHIRTQSL